MNEDLRSPVVNKKRDASSPLQHPSDSYKRTKQASEKLLSDLNDTLHLIEADLNSSHSDSIDSAPPDSSTPVAKVDRKQVMASKISDEDIDRIARAVRSIMVPDIEVMIDKRVGAIRSEYDGKIKSLQTDNTKLRSRVNELESENADLRSDIVTMQDEMDDVKWRGDELEQYSRRNSFRISGISEGDQRSTDQIVIDIANKYSVDIDIKDIDRSHRVGVKADGKTRAILVKCTSYRAKHAFMEKKQDLEDDLYFNDDLTRLRSNLLYKARKVFKADKLNGAWAYNGKVYIKDAKDAKYEIKSELDIDRLASKKPIDRKKDSKKSTGTGSVISSGATPMER